MTSLSREAMSLMELSPAWRLREALRPAAPVATSPCAVMVLAQDDRAARLWASIARAMTLLGYDSHAVADALVMQSPVADRMVHELKSRPSRQWMVFGDVLAEELGRMAGDLASGAEIARLPSLQSMLGEATSGAANAAAMKRQLWSMLCAHRGAAARDALA